jgi:hypothetical protein
VKKIVGSEQARGDPELSAAFARVEREGRGGVTPLGRSLDLWKRAHGLTRRRAVPEAHTAFHAAIKATCGAEIARRARPVKFLRGTLTVEVDSAALLAELESFRAEDLRAATNRELGRPDVRRIGFRPTS